MTKIAVPTPTATASACKRAPSIVGAAAGRKAPQLVPKDLMMDTPGLE